MQLLEILKAHLNRQGLSDFYFSVGHRPAARVRGQIVYFSDSVITQEDMRKFLEDLKIPLKKCDKGVTIEGKRLRCNLSQTWQGWDFTARLLPSEIKKLGELGLPEFLYQYMLKKQGLIIIAGPTGSGKSTTLASMIEYVNETCEKKIITIEDPIEYVFTPKKSLILQREVESGESFLPYLKEALRQTPDIIMVGELRDLDTVKTALQASETGHLVVTTLHTSSVEQSISRIIDTQPEAVRNEVRLVLASAILLVIIQKLVKGKNGLLKPALEILVNSPAAENCIRTNRIHQLPNIIMQGKRDGSILLNDSLRKLIREGFISIEEARRYAYAPEALTI